MPSKEYYLPQRQLISQQDHAMVQKPNVPRAKFFNRFSRKATYHAGYIYPFMVQEVLPGDHLTYNIRPFLRLNTPLFPILDQLRVDIHVWFVPARILWVNFVRMMGEQDNPTDSIAYTVPQIVSPANGFAINDLYDHMGIPPVGQIVIGETIPVNALPLRAYNLIYNLNYRDQNAMLGIAQLTDNGPDPQANYVIRPRAKSHDYFTGALPWAQKFTAPTVPILGTAPITGIGFQQAVLSGAGPAVNVNESASLPARAYATSVAGSAVGLFLEANPVDATRPHLYADLTAATGININQLRTAWLVQEILEQDARGGTRYQEKLEIAFGVHNPDGRFQRPEYMGGGQHEIQVTPIAQTAPTATEPLGALGGAGTATGQSTASIAATEYGYVIGLLSIKSELSYQQGLHKLWSRQTRFDFYHPLLDGLGEQAILRKEIYVSGVEADDDTVFGYIPRWDELRQCYSDVAGLMRSTTAGSIDQWHLAQEFGVTPELGPTFLYDTPPMTRVLAAGAEAANQHLIGLIEIERTAVRPMSTYGTPATLSRY